MSTHKEALRKLYYSLSDEDKSMFVKSLISQLRPDQKIAVQNILCARRVLKESDEEAGGLH